MSKFVLMFYRLAFALHSWGIPILPGLINKLFVRLLCGCQIGLGARLGEGVELSYGGLGVVIHDRCVLGKHVRIATGVTLGGMHRKVDVPIIGDYSVIHTGAKVIGPIKIGERCIVGANAVVIKDMPDASIAVGVPARIIKTDIDIAEYRIMPVSWQPKARTP